MNAYDRGKGETIASRVPEGIQDWPVERVATDAGDLWFPLDDLVMREHARNSGQWDPAVGQVLLDAAKNRSDGLFIDVGANVGYFSCLLSKRYPALRTLAFEPQPKMSALLQLNVWPHGDRVRVHSCALGEKRGVIGLRSSRNNLGDTRGVDEQEVDMLAPCISLDALYPELQADLVKIDVQGYELQVLRGMAGVIARSPEIRIVVEFSPELLRAEHIDPLQALDAYRAFGLRVLMVGNGTLQELNNNEIMRYCSSAGPSGQVDLLLSRA
ncbi:FkbM family methyltransferase [Stenotrophomonas indicatrix]|uniref:FkbM family methyltransferase n=1 Tax=Stenotrophomonas indicatrix TaxID=2045451 RepID=UPI000FDA0C2E|nr:FkbM family methyltransferase [Stenotrophomonas indicatrix]